MKLKGKPGRPKSGQTKERMTLMLEMSNASFVRWYAASRAINLSSAANYLVGAVLRGETEMLRALVSEYTLRRQF